MAYNNGFPMGYQPFNPYMQMNNPYMQQVQQMPQMQQQTPPQMQPQMAQQNMGRGMNPGSSTAGYTQRQSSGAVAFEDVSYFPDADQRAYNRPLPGAEELAMEARKTEAYEERFRNSSTYAGAQAGGGQELPFDKEKFTEDIHSIVHTEVVKCYKNPEAAVNESAEKVMSSYGKIASPKPLFRVMIVLLVLDLILDIILILHNFLGVI